jgi:hypothetical protein
LEVAPIQNDPAPHYGSAVSDQSTWNTADAIAEHRVMTPEQRLRKAIQLSRAALRLARAPRVDVR